MFRPPTVFGRLTAVLAILTMLSATSGCGGENDAAGGKINVGAISIVDVAPLYLGKQKGIFTKHGIDLTITPTSGGAEAVPGVVSGQFSFAFGNVTSILIGRDQGLDLKMVANGVNSTGKPGADFGAVLVRKGSPIKTSRDLAGKTVSVNNLRNIGDTTIRHVVRKDGGDPASVKFVELPFPDAPAALQSRQVDAAWVVEPFVTQARAQGARVVAWNFAEAVPDLTIAAYFTSAKVIADQPVLVRRFVAAAKEASAYAETHPDEVREVLKTYTKIPAKVIPKIVMPSWPTQINRQSVEATAALARQDGLLRKNADVRAALYP
jgi:NitT/TauT family transport system substrate-binding protein